MSGDINLVNGRPWPYHKVEARAYRLSILDASISRPYSLKFLAESEDGQEQVTVTTCNCQKCNCY
jgi:FtsP/CotA-like multicopper oxidase with cupredoxin domain